MTEYAYDPEFPFVVADSNDHLIARAENQYVANVIYRAFNETGRLIDTTPRPKIPEDARFIYWKDVDGYPVFAERDRDEWLLADGSLYSTEDLLRYGIKDSEITVLVPKEEA